MKETTFAFKITCLQTMLPSVMKAEYQSRSFCWKEIIPSRIFSENGILSWQDAESAGLPAVEALREAAVVELQYLVKNKNKAKMTRYIERKIDPAEIPAVQQQLRKGAKRKLEILQILTEETRPVSFYRTRVSTAALNQAQEAGWLTFTKLKPTVILTKTVNFKKRSRLR